MSNTSLPLTLAMRKLSSVVTLVTLVFSLAAPLPIVQAAITTNTATATPFFVPTIKAASSAQAIFGINAVESGGETLNSVRLTINGGTGFTTTDLATMATDATSGLAVYADDAVAGTSGSFDSQDDVVTLSAAPTLTQVTQESKITPSATALVSDAAMTITAGDIVFTNVSANPTDTAYGWHLVTTGATGVNHANLRLDAAGSAPSYVASSRFSKLTPAGTATGNAATAGGTLAVDKGNLVFARRATESTYTWHIVTSADATTLSDDATENTAALNGEADDGAVTANTQFSKLVPAGTATDNGSTAAQTLTVALGDLAFLKIGSSYGWHIVTTAGDLSSDATENTARIDGGSSDPAIIANSQMSKLSTAGGTFQVVTDTVADTSRTITPGDVMFAQTTNNPRGTSSGWRMVTTGGTGVAAAALRLNDKTSAPVFGWVTTLSLAAGFDVATDNAGANAGDDLFIVVKTASGATNARTFSLGIGPGDIGYSANTPTNSPTESTASTITIDTVAPTLNAGSTGPANNSTGVPISAFIHLGFSENLDPTTVTPANVTFTAGGTGVPSGIRPFPDGFDIVVSSPPTFAASSRFARVASTSTAFYSIFGNGQTISPQPPSGYASPTAGDIVITQRETFPPEVGLITNATLTSGTFSVNGFQAFGGQQVTKFATPAATSAVDQATAVTTGDIVVAMTSANPTGVKYDWHMVTTGANINAAGLRLDGSGAAPTFGTHPGGGVSRFASITPTATVTDNGATGGNVLAVSVGDMVFIKVGSSYGWHLVTTAGNLSSDATENTAFIDGGASDPAITASSQMSRLAPGAEGAVSASTALSFGDIVLAHTTANASNGGAYAFHMVSGAAAVNSTDLRFDNFPGSLTPSTAYVVTATTGVKDSAGNPLASNQTVSFTTGATGGTNTTPPFVQSSQPGPGSQNHPTGAPLKLTFSVDMASSGAGDITSASNIGLFLDNFGAPGTAVTTTKSYDSATKTVTLVPGSALTANTNYVVKVNTTATSTTGTAFVQPFFLFFRTSSGTDATAPTVGGVSPASGSTGVSLGAVITAGFSEDMDPSTITASTILLKKTSDSSPVTGNVSYNPNSKSASFSPSVALETNTGYTFTVKSGSSGVKDLSTNQLAADNNTTFTTTATADTALPFVTFSNADNFSVAVTFNETMKTGGGPSGVDNVTNYTLESPVGSTIGLAGKTVVYDAGTKTARIIGLSLQNGNTFKVTAATNTQDLSGNAIDTTGTPAKNTTFGTVQNSNGTGGQIGPGGGTIDPGQQGMNPTRVTPMSKGAGAVSNYKVEFLAGTSIPVGGQIVLTFPAGFTLSSASAVSAANSFCNTDMNGPATGAPTIASVAGDNDAGTVTITTATAVTGANAFLCLDLASITNSTVPSSSGYTVTIQTRDTAGNNRATLQTLTAAPFYLGSAGSSTLTVNVFKDANSNGVNNAGEGINGATVFLFSPATGGTEVITATNVVAGVATFANLANGDYQVGLKPTSAIDVAFNSMPQFVSISGNTTKNFALSNAAAITIGGNIDGSTVANGTKVDVFASSPTGFAKTTVTLNGTATNAYSLPVQANTTYNVGVGPSIPESSFTPGAPPPPPPTFTFMPPPNTEVVVASTNVTGKNFTLSATNKTITGTVVDSAGTGVSNAGVFCRPPQTSTGGTASGFGTGGQTNTSGAFTINVTPGEYLCGVFKPGMPPVSDKSITVPSSGTNSPTSLAFVLDISSAGLTITGTIKDDGGNAIPYAGVSGRKVVSTSDTTPVGGDSGNFVGGPSDANGAYTLYVSAGTWVVEAFAPGFGKLGTKTITITTSSSSGQDFSAQTLSMGTITGTVTVGGTATQGVMVRAESSGGANGNMAPTGADGTYSLRVPAGTYTLTAFVPGKGEATPITGVAVTANTTTSGQNFTIGAGITITVNVTDGTNPITNAGIDVRDSNGRGNFTNTSSTSGANAVYTVSVPPGTYTVRVGHPAYGPISTTTSVSTTQTITATASAGSTKAVTGTVTGDAVALSGAWVSLIGTPTGQTNTVFLGSQSASDGTFSVSVPAGSYRLRVDKPGYQAPAESTITVTNANIAAGTIALTTASRTITGQVTLSGSGISNAFVDASDGVGGYAVSQTDASGNYSLAVGNGTWNVRAHSSGYEGGPLSVAVSGSNRTGQNIALTAISGFTITADKPETITPSSGGFLTNQNIGDEFKLNIPANALGTGSNAATVTTKQNTGLPNPPSGAILSKSAVSISAVDSSGSPVKNLNDDVTITIPYNQADLPSGSTEGSLVIGVWNETTQTYDTLSTTVDTVNDTLTATVSHFSDFAPMVASSGSAPSAPTGLMVTNTGAGAQLSLSWSSVSGASTYNVYRSTDNSSFPLLASTASTSYSSTGLTNGTTYYYKVSAVNGTGDESAATSAVSAAPSVSAGGGGGGGGSAPVTTASPTTITTTTTTTTATTSSGDTMGPSLSPFQDIANHFSAGFVEQLYEMGVVQGRSETTFEPDASITRAELVKIALLTFEYDVEAEAVGAVPFTDTDPQAWYAAYLSAARQAGIAFGYEDGSFKPNEPVKRSEALKILLLAAQKTTAGAPPAPFTDVPQTLWFTTYVNYAFANGIVSGKNETTFAPGDNITRGEMAKIAIKTYELP